MNKLTAQILIGVLLLLLGSTVILGWVVQLPKLTQILPGYPAMVFNTALSFALSGAALLLPSFHTSRTAQYQAGLGGFLIVFNLLVLAQSLFDIDLGLDGAALHKRLQYDHSHPGRMAPGTSLAFIIFGALLLRDQLKPLAGRLVHSLQVLLESSFGRRGKEQQIHTIVENVVDGIITIDESGTIESFNNGATKIFGYSPEEIMGKKVKTLMPEKIHGKHQNCLLNLNAVPLPATGKHVELMGMHKDGSYMPLELAVNETRLGDRRLFVGVVRNIAQRKRAEAELI
ncbi:MAG: PAS domain S-box protein, partial [Burkholderiales bacterium]